MRLMKSCIIKRTSILFLSLFILATTLMSLALSRPVAASSNTNYVDDGADLLTNQEEEDLNELLFKYSKKYNIDIVVITRNGLDGKTDKRYLEDYVDKVLDAGVYSEDLTILQYDIDSRYCTIQGYGNSEYIINDDNIEYILDVVAPKITEKQYYNAFSSFAKGVAHYYDDPHYEYGRKPIYLETWFQAVAALAIGAIVVGTMAYNSKGKNTVNNHTYLDEQHSGLVARRDIYLRTTVSKVRKPSNNTSGGGGRSSGGGGRSGGGRSHSGGSRRC